MTSYTLVCYVEVEMLQTSDLQAMPTNPKTSRLKALVLGENGVGKTSLCTFLSKSKATNNNRNTLGVALHSGIIKINRSPLKIVYFNLAPLEQIQQLRSRYYPKTDLAIFVFDLTKPATFEAIPKYIDDFQTVMSEVPFILVGNKVDLTVKSRKRVSHKQVSKLIKSYQKEHNILIPYVEVSFTDMKNVDNIAWLCEETLQSIVSTMYS